MSLSLRLLLSFFSKFNFLGIIQRYVFLYIYYIYELTVRLILHRHFVEHFVSGPESIISTRPESPILNNVLPSTHVYLYMRSYLVSSLCRAVCLSENRLRSANFWNNRDTKQGPQQPTQVKRLVKVPHQGYNSRVATKTCALQRCLCWTEPLDKAHLNLSGAGRSRSRL